MAKMASATKYTFDTVFSDERGTDAAHPRQHKVLTDSEIESLCEKARAEGMQAGDVRAREAVAAGTRETAEALRDLLNDLSTQMESVRADAAGIAFALARKVASAAIAAFPAGEVEAALRKAMHEAIGEPRIALHARPEVVEALASRIAEIAHDEGYDGRVQIQEDASLSGADCRIDWRGGGAERTNAAIEAALEEIMTRRFAPRNADLQNRSDS